VLALALVPLAALCWGISGGIAGILMADGWDAFVVAFYRGAIGLVCVLGWLALRPNDSSLADRRLWLWAALAGIGVVGVALLTRIYDIDTAAVSPMGVAAGLLSGLCYAVFIFAFRNAGAYGSPQAVLAIAFTVLAAVLIWPGDDEQTVAALTTPDWRLFAALGGLGAGVSFFFYVVGMRRTRPTTASIVAMVEPITATLFGVAIMGERLAGLQLVGMGLILVMVTALSLSAARATD